LTAVRELTAKYQRQLRGLRRHCQRVDRLHLSGALGVKDCELVYESGFLTAFAHWEHFLWELIVQAVCGPPSPKPGNSRLLKPRSRAAFTKILLQNRSYLSLSSYPEVVKCARLYLKEGRPFSALDDTYRTRLEEARYVRDAIAHRSRYAITRFRQRVGGVASVPQSRRHPGPFLRHVYRVSPTKTRLDLYVDTFILASEQLALAW